MTENTERGARADQRKILDTAVHNGTDGNWTSAGAAHRLAAGSQKPDEAVRTPAGHAVTVAQPPADGSEEPPGPDGPLLPADGQSALVTEILHLIAPLTEAVANPLQLARLLARTGWNPAAAGEHGTAEVAAWLENVAGAVGGLHEFLLHLPQDLEGLGLLLDTVGATMDLVREVPPALGAFDAFAFAEDTVHFLVTDWLLRHHPVLYHALVLIGVVVLPEEAAPQTPVVNQDGEPVRTGVARARLRPQRLVDLVADPVAALRADYLPDGLADEARADAFAATLLPRLGGLLHELGVRVLAGLGETAGTGLDAASVTLGRRMLTLGIPVRLAPGVNGEIGATLGISSPTAGDLGVVVVPRGEAVADQLLGGGWALRADLSGAGPAVAIGPRGVTFAADTAGRVELTLELSKAGGQPNTPAVLLGSAAGTRLEIGQFRAWTRAVLEDTHEGAEGRDDFEIGIAADKAALVVTGGDGDGFLAQVLPAEGLRTEFALGLQWSRRRGLSFTGSAGLDSTLPVNARLGPIELQSLHLRLKADKEHGTLHATVSATARLTLGPVQAVIERIGLTAGLTTTNGNLGPVGLGAAFTPPRGAALAVAAGPVSGGGYLFFDRDKEEYAGVLALQMESIALKAVGLLTTKAPDGTDGFSLLVLISAEFTPVQLGFGFTLVGVGGLIGVNRSVSADTLRAGIRTGALDTVLFPRDPLARAPEIISVLGAVFPPTPGRHVVGPMARIGWGTPTLLTLDLGLLLELPTPVRLVLLGRLRMALPTEEAAAIVISMDVLGVIDFERGEASVDATLHDSRIAAFALTGDMAVRARWKGTPSFALSAGGFHPRFQRPEGFPELRRLSLALLNGDNPRLRLEAYFALTSNTIQFGARLELYAAALGFSVEGMLAFDTLVQFEPFGFEAAIAGSLALKRGGRVLMGVAAEVALSGPAPWHVRGRARFEILFFSGEIGFDHTLGERGAPAALPVAVNVAARVEEALADPRNWTAQLTGAGRTVVTLRELPDVDGQLVVHPLGGLAFTQRVAPLGITLTRFGGAPVDGPRRLDLDPQLTVEEAGPGATPLTVALTSAHEYFAPAQFLDLSDEEKISAPSFELLAAGATVQGAVAAERERTGVFTSRIGYEEIVQDGPHRTAMTGPAPAAGLRTAAGPAARRTGRQRFATAPRGLGVRDTRWTAVGRQAAPSGAAHGTERSAAPATTGTTWTEAAEHRRAAAAEGLRIVPDTAPGGVR
ncbi:DUF6603 domain-containing protein [Streptomyces caelestis]|uniref:DUF6603 domain-containing protein n=1 Tax=Streptomyces caelestis TaxID=36816 RepID=UPI00364C8AFA